MPSTSAETPSQRAVTLETLQLLQEAVDYLNRLPAVPVTRELSRKLQAHLDAPHVLGAQREAAFAEHEASIRHGRVYSPVGQPLFEVVADGEFVYLRTGHAQDHGDQRRLNLMREGFVMRLEKTPPNFIPWHLEMTKP